MAPFVLRLAALAGAAVAAVGALACTSSDVTCDAPGTQVTRVRAAGCFAVSEGAILLVRTGDGWCIPGGFADEGESGPSAAVRETLEEAGIPVRALEPICGAPSTGFVAYRCAVDSPRPRLRPDGVEVGEAVWMTADALRALPDDALRFPSQRAAYLRALVD